MTWLCDSCVKSPPATAATHATRARTALLVTFWTPQNAATSVARLEQVARVVLARSVVQTHSVEDQGVRPQPTSGLVRLS